MHRFTCKLLSVVCGECTKFKHINKHFNFQIVSSLYSWACFNSLSSHHVLPNPQDLSLAARRTVQVLMYNHAWSLLCYFQILMTFVERRRQDAKPRAWILSSVKAAKTGRGELGAALSLAACGRSCAWFSPFPGCRWLLAQPVGASRAKARCGDKLFLSLAILLHFLGSHRDGPGLQPVLAACSEPVTPTGLRTGAVQKDSRKS